LDGGPVCHKKSSIVSPDSRKGPRHSIFLLPQPRYAEKYSVGCAFGGSIFLQPANNCSDRSRRSRNLMRIEAFCPFQDEQSHTPRRPRKRARKMRRGRWCFGNKPIAADGLSSAVIAFFAEHSTLICGNTIIPLHRTIARRRGIPVRGLS
jgi:hypothetical protein